LSPNSRSHRSEKNYDYFLVLKKKVARSLLCENLMIYVSDHTHIWAKRIFGLGTYF